MITLKKDEKRMITVFMDADSSNRHSGEETDSRIDSGQARMTDRRLDVILAGENASVEVVGLVLAKNQDEKSIEANIVHAAPNTKSNVNIRSVLRDRSTFAFRGNVKIEKGAKGADAYLRSDALLFDEAKMGDDTPALEILEPDVKAGHAATIGKVDEEMIFYLMSRGLTRDQSEKMIISGFIEPIRNVILGSEATPESNNTDSGQARMTNRKKNES
ncbi:SufD family Fe-S cluster assembly protein [Candidatus Curtissbacteria bacterium]|nr:SufD family Fe-S cluster assembly protein [Candidatus Curtissbacteria bacterium]